VGWFPREELAAALERWPDLDGELADADGYCRRLDARLRELVGASARRPVIAPLRVGELIEYADREGLHPADASTRAGLSVELDRLGETVAWPPARNELCWCGSGRKYKRCCAALRSRPPRLTPGRWADRAPVMGVPMVSSRHARNH
jgi:SEC-C motif